MKHFQGLTPAEFYRLRDQRTELCVGSEILGNAAVHISIDESEASTPQGQLAFLTLVNLSARWCRNISISAPDQQVHPRLASYYHGRLRDEALKIANMADPFINVSSGGFEARIHVHVGTLSPQGSFSVCGRDWVAFAGAAVIRAPKPTDDENFLGTLLSSCIGAAHAMRVAIGDDELYEDIEVSLWNLETGAAATNGPVLAPSTIGRLLMVGLGAVGSSLAYTLAMTPMRPNAVALVDADAVDYPNLNRSPVFFAEHVGKKKVDVVSQCFPGLTPDLAPNRVEDAVRSGLRIDQFDLVIPAANVPEARTTIMTNTPPLMISASTGTQWDAYKQRHIPLQDDCLICRFPMKNPLPAMACATGSIAPLVAESDAAPQTGALPFLSLAGAIVATADICKIPFEQSFREGTNRSILSFRGSELILASSHRLPKPGCSYCTKPDVFEALGSKRLFATYSQLR